MPTRPLAGRTEKSRSTFDTRPNSCGEVGLVCTTFSAMFELDARDDRFRAATAPITPLGISRSETVVAAVCARYR